MVQKMLRNPRVGRLEGGRDKRVWKTEEKESGRKEMKRNGTRISFRWCRRSTEECTHKSLEWNNGMGGSLLIKPKWLGGERSDGLAISKVVRVRRVTVRRSPRQVSHRWAKRQTDTHPRRHHKRGNKTAFRTFVIFPDLTHLFSRRNQTSLWLILTWAELRLVRLLYFLNMVKIMSDSGGLECGLQGSDMLRVPSYTIDAT
jgi:hypothetical protein